MQQMKYSGIKWIGQVPNDWNLVRLKNIFVNRCGGAWGEEAKDERKPGGA